jgi:hypothetical protein
MRAGAGVSITKMKMQQRAKIEEFRAAVVQSGSLTLHQQAHALGLSRSTAWSVLRACHKNSGISASVITRMLASSHLPIAARQRLLEYVQEKIAGVYGHSDRRRRTFAANLPLKEMDDFGLEYDATLPSSQVAKPGQTRLALKGSSLLSLSGCYSGGRTVFVDPFLSPRAGSSADGASEQRRESARSGG